VPMQDVYRACASIAVFRPAEVCSPEGCGTIYQILLLRKPRKRDQWQLPQGGIEEGETLEYAALRELKEEAGMDLEVVGRSERVYQYDFPASYRRFRPDNVCGQRIEFCYALAPKDATVQVDGEEIEDHVWVLPEQISQYIKRPEYLDLVRKVAVEGQKLIESS